MIRLIEDERAETMATGRRNRVRRLGVFGSAASGDFDPQHSGLDFVVEFGHTLVHACDRLAAEVV